MTHSNAVRSKADASSSGMLRSLTGFQLTTADAPTLARFYRDALGFTPGPLATTSPVDLTVFGLSGGAHSVCLRVGSQQIELQMFDIPGRAYPLDSTAADLIFQHLAIVTSDAALAWERARAFGAVPISRAGVVTLPVNNGGIKAIKFRDPEGHPLELIEFPSHASANSGAMLLGIDHSAISVANVDVATRFFGKRGLNVGEKTLNCGPAQVALDGLEDVKVDVVPMLPIGRSPHLELLRYRAPPARGHAPLKVNDIAATRIVWESDIDGLIQDPAGHFHLLRNSSAP